MINLLNKSNGNGMDRRNFVKNIMGGFALAAFSANKLNASIYKRINEMTQKVPLDESPDGVFWDYVAKQYMFEEGLIMMNNGTIGPMPRTVFNTLMKYYKVQATNPYLVYEKFYPFIEDARLKAAKFIKALPDEIALVRNTTEGLNYVANGLDMKPGEEVLMSNLEHPSGTNPWKLKEKRVGIKIKEVKLNSPPKDKNEILNAFNDAITPNTRIIHISHTIYQNGLIPPLKELSKLAHDKNLLIVADAAHGIGMMELDMHELGADFYATSPYKWAGAPIGAGIFYVRKESMDTIWPTIVSGGWDSMAGARKFDCLGQISEPILIALTEALHFLDNIDMKRVDRRIKSLSYYLKTEAAKIPGVTVYTPMDPALSAGLNVLSLKDVKSDYIVNYLLERYDLVIRTIFREKDAIRISTPIWINHKHIDMILEALKYLGAKK